MRKLSKNYKRGVVLEMAILVIFILASVSILIITFSSLGTLRTKKMLSELQDNVLVDSVAEGYIDYYLTGKVGEFTENHNFTVSESEDNGVVELQFFLEGELRLNVRLKKSFDGTNFILTVLDWKY